MTGSQMTNSFPRSRTDIMFGLLMRQLPIEITEKIWLTGFLNIFSFKALIELIGLNRNLDYFLSRVFKNLEVALYRLDSSLTWAHKEKNDDPTFYIFNTNENAIDRDLVSIGSTEFDKLSSFLTESNVRIKSLSLNAEVLDALENDISFANFFQCIDDIKFHQSTSGALNYALKLGHLNLRYLSALDDINFDLQDYLPFLEHVSLQFQTHKSTDLRKVLTSFPPNLQNLKIHYIVPTSPILGQRLVDFVNSFSDSRSEPNVQISLDFSAIGYEMPFTEVSNLINIIKPIDHTIRHVIITPILSCDKFNWVENLPNLKSITLDANSFEEHFEINIKSDRLEELHFYDSMEFNLNGVSNSLKKLVLYNTILPKKLADNLPQSLHALELHYYPNNPSLNQITFPKNLTNLIIEGMESLPQINYEMDMESCKLRNVALLKCEDQKNLQDFIDNLPQSVITLKIKPFLLKTELNLLGSLQTIEIGNDDVITLNKLPVSIEYSYQPVILDTISDIVRGYRFRELTVEISKEESAGPILKRVIDNFEWLVSLKVITKVGYLGLDLLQSRELRKLSIHFKHETFQKLQRDEENIVIKLIELPYTLNSFKITCDEPKPKVQLHLRMITDNIKRSGVLDQVDEVININR